MSSAEIIPDNRVPVPGWKGGFAATNPKFAYPAPDLSSLPLKGNFDGVNFLTRQVHVLWPEFSWLADPGNPDSRCFEMFAPDISRAGYDDAGRVWSVICPQQGSYSPTLGDLNIEVTVTGQRGWIDESVPDPFRDLLALDLNVVGRVWFGPGARESRLFVFLAGILGAAGLPFSKDNAIQILLHKEGSPDEHTIPVRSGLSPDYLNPEFALHVADAWGVAYLGVGIGPIQTTNNEVVDSFNQLVMDIVNLGSGNILKAGSVLTWNVWFDAPTHVSKQEWLGHAKFWRDSIDTGHGSPDGQPATPRYFDGTPFSPVANLLDEELSLIRAWVAKYSPVPLPEAIVADLISKRRPGSPP